VHAGHKPTTMPQDFELQAFPTSSKLGHGCCDPPGEKVQTCKLCIRCPSLHTDTCDQRKELYAGNASLSKAYASGEVNVMLTMGSVVVVPHHLDILRCCDILSLNCTT
jgi:hypothetical protein